MRRTLVLLTLSVAIAACDSAGPVAFEGIYDLVESNGQTLPIEYFPGSATQIEGGQLTVDGATHFNVGLLLSGAGTQTHTFSFTREGDSLVITGMGMGGRVSGRTLRVRLMFPLPPSQGFGLTGHDMVFFR